MRILCLPYTHTYSHLGRILTAAHCLRIRGHEIAIAGNSPKLDIARKQGFPVFPLHEPDPKTLFDNIRRGKLRFVTSAELNGMIEADMELLRAFQPDAVLSDGRFSARISTQLAGIRHAAIVNASSTAYRAEPYVPLRPLTWLARRFPQWATRVHAVNLRLEMTVFDATMSVFSQLSRKYRLSRPVTATNCLTGADVTLLADIPEYFPTVSLPAHYHYIGPLFWHNAPSAQPDTSEAADHTHVPVSPATSADSRPLLFVSMGSTAIPGLFEATFRMLESEGMRGIIATGGQHDALPTDHPDIQVAPFVHAENVLPHAALVLCHGGNGTIYQALSHGVPVVGMPTIPDQAFNMRRVEALGVGRTVLPRHIASSPDILRDTVRTVLRSPSYRQQAETMRGTLSCYDAPARCAYWMETLR